MKKNIFIKKYPGNYPKRNGILPGVAGLLWTRLGLGESVGKGKGHKYCAINETDNQPFRMVTLWFMCRRGANGKGDA